MLRVVAAWAGPEPCHPSPRPVISCQPHPRKAPHPWLIHTLHSSSSSMASDPHLCSPAPHPCPTQICLPISHHPLTPGPCRPAPFSPQPLTTSPVPSDPLPLPHIDPFHIIPQPTLHTGLPPPPHSAPSTSCLPHTGLLPPDLTPGPCRPP